MGVGFVTIDGEELGFDLLAEGDYGWEVGGYEIGVDGCTAIGEVVGLKKGFVVCGR